ncbi:MAG: hypothetical protein HRT73_08415 [Flavobacteriales bacterium]|nr:hypothetical protein [Flavobacteriales bacterium]NQX97886.1 hypothetical protein [Flavobacteriales bacterium]
MTAFLYWLGHFMDTVFENTLVPLGNIPNWIFITTGFLLLFWWLGLQKKYNKEADSNPDQLK